MIIDRIHGLPFAVTGIGNRKRPPELDMGPSAFAFLFGLMLYTWRRRKQRHAMAGLSDHLLRDIGISRTEAAWSSELSFRLS